MIEKEDRTLLMVAALLLLFVLLAASLGCATQYKAQVEANSTAIKTTDTTEPVAVPKSFKFKAWGLRPVPTLNPPGLVSPPPPSDLSDPAFSLADPFYFEGEVDYGEAPKTTREVDSNVNSVKSESEGSSKPVGLFAFLSGWWPLLILGAAGAALALLRPPWLAVPLTLLKSLWTRLRGS